jgi:hypothetical protein
MKKLVIFLLLAIISASCVEKIDIKLDPNSVRLVVDGSITTDTSKCTVNLTQTADYFYNAPIPRVTNANVTIYDGDSTFTLNETEPGKSGIYATEASFHGIVGKTYTLNVNLAGQIGGNVNYSSSSRLMSVTHLDSTTVVLHKDWGKDGFYEVKIFAQDPGNEVNFYMFNFYKNGRLMSDSISKVVVSDDKYINGSYISGLGAFYLNQTHSWERLYPDDTITLQMSGITKEYYNFVSEVQSAGFNIPFFMGPPANVVGNVNNGGVGFFTAYSNSYANTVIKQ